MNEMPRRVSMQFPGGREALLARMDKAFGLYSQEADKLSVMLGKTSGPSSWTSYHELLRQRTAELVAYEQYRQIRDELFGLINAPSPEPRRESSVS